MRPTSAAPRRRTPSRVRGAVAGAVCVVAAVAAHAWAGGAVAWLPVVVVALVAVPAGYALAGREADLGQTAARALLAQGAWHTVFMLTAAEAGHHAVDAGAMLGAHLLAAAAATAVCFSGEHQLDAVRRWVVGLVLPRLLLAADVVVDRPQGRPGPQREVAPRLRHVVVSHPRRGPPAAVALG